MADFRRFRAWQQPEVATVQNIIKQYERGFRGCEYDPVATERLASYGYASAEQAAADLGYEDTAAGELVLPYRLVEEKYPLAYPGPAQRRGSCVMHCTRNAGLITMVSEAVAGEPDPISGKVEECPEVSQEAERSGVLCIEPGYHYRGHKSDGWWCHAAADVMVQKTGAVIRKDYGFIDLTRLDSDYAGKYWKESQIPEEHKEAFDDNLFQDAAEASTFEVIRDFLARGLGVSSCGSEGFSKKRDENGVSKRSGSWAHAMAVIGADDRREIHSRYGGPLLLIQNSWGGNWNSGPRTILGTDIEIPVGCFWARWREVKNRSYSILAGVNGWARKLLPDLAGGYV